MAIWYQNFINALKNKPVILLYGNVRDMYIIENKRIFGNLTEVFKHIVELANSHQEGGKDFPAFQELYFFDVARKSTKFVYRDGTLQGPESEAERAENVVILARWARALCDDKSSTFRVIYYLDKLIQYQQSYSSEEMNCILYLEKMIENISDSHRLVMVALQDSLIPVELYTMAPKCQLIHIPLPSKKDRRLYLEFKMSKDEHAETLADLTDGMFLYEINRIADHVMYEQKEQKLSEVDIRRIVNLYRFGLKEDYWSDVRIEALARAFDWFTKTEGVKGQDHAVERVVSQLIVARAGLSGIGSERKSRPRCVFFFAGPTGVGKTLLAKKIAKFLFKSAEAYLRFDMSEFKEEHTISKLIGSPPGYVGFERGGMLTNAVREKPFSVILFDEIEKAHPRIMDIFLQILDEGRLTDSRGQTVFFTENVIIFTSNIGCRTIDSLGRSVEDREKRAIERIMNDSTLTPEEKRARIQQHFVQCVERFFTVEISRPELLNRIGSNIIPFNFITEKETQLEIIRSHTQRIREEFQDLYRKWGYTLEFDPSVFEMLVERYHERMSEFGGRGITNAIEEEILNVLAMEVLRCQYKNERNRHFRILCRNGELHIEVFLK